MTAPGEVGARTWSFPSVGPMPKESSLRSLTRDSLLQAERVLHNWALDRSTTIQTIVHPTLTLLMLRLVLGDTVQTASGQPAVYGLVPLITLIAAIQGSIVCALGLNKEITSGLLSRFATLPIHRAAGLVGRMLAEGARIFVTTALLVLVGVALGFRFQQGPLAAIALFALPIIFGMGFAVVITALATVAAGPMLVAVVGLATSLLMFFNSGFVPIMAYPTWLQDVVANQPMSCAIEAMRGLSIGGPVAEPLLKTTAWSLGMIALFLVPAVRGYQRAAAAP